MYSLEDFTPNELLNVLEQFKGAETKEEFYLYFNDIRNHFSAEHGGEENFATPRGQFIKWMNQGMGISKKNFNSEIALYVLQDIYDDQEHGNALSRLIHILSVRGYDVSEYASQISCLNSFKETEDLFFSLCNSLVHFAFHHDRAEKRIPSPELPSHLTDTKYVSPQSILYRDKQLMELEALLLPTGKKNVAEKENVLVWGFGGCGKTSVARVFYGKMLKTITNAQYASIGWIDYQGSLKESFLHTNTVKLSENEKDDEKRWKAIKKALLHDRNNAQVLLFIDNVDQNASLGQFPSDDQDLQEFADSPSVNLVLTSRQSAPIREGSFTSIELNNLEEDDCIELFLYYRKAKRVTDEDRAYIRDIVQLAGCHTLAVSQIAQYSRFRSTESVLRELKEKEFHIGSAQDETSVIEELIKIFNLRSRTPDQRRVIWDYAVLPQLSLSLDESTLLFEHPRIILESLADEGWLTFDGGFTLHPLVKSSVLAQGPVPLETFSAVISHIVSKDFLSPSDTHAQAMRKISMVEYALAKLPNETLSADFYYQLGLLEYRVLRKRQTSLAYLDQACSLYEQCSNNTMKLADLKFDRGYIKSTTHNYREEAEFDLREALELWQSAGDYPEEVDKVRDHLGYVLSDSPETYSEAEEHLRSTYITRKRRMEEKPNKRHRQDFGTTADNLGFLLMKTQPQSAETTDLLKEAYNVREDILRDYGDTETEVAWTAYNLGQHLSMNLNDHVQAASYLERALAIRRDQDRKAPGNYTANILTTLVALANVYACDPARIEDAFRLYTEAKSILPKIDADHNTFFIEKTTEDLARLAEFFSKIE